MCSASSSGRLRPRAGAVRVPEKRAEHSGLTVDRRPIDVYCYACNDAKIDPELAAHLATFGIEVAGQSKTEKSMTELVGADWTAMSGSADGNRCSPGPTANRAQSQIRLLDDGR